MSHVINTSQYNGLVTNKANPTIAYYTVAKDYIAIHIIDFKFKGVVRWHCFEVKPFNLLACFTTNCDMKYYDTCIKMADHGQQCTIMYEL